MSASKDLVKILKESEKKGTEPYDTEATVKRIDGSTAWVHIPGGVDETPVQLTIGSRVGDKVQVRVSGGRAWLVGNASAPPTDDSTAITINKQTNRYMKSVEAKVDSVSKIAGDTNQYFWHTESGTDTGAHITEIPQSAFLMNPENGGGNLLARSNGIAVRDGLTELATFGERIIIGLFSKTHAAIDFHSLQMVDKNGNTYAHISDLRDASGEYELSETFIADGLRRQWNLTSRASNTNYTVTLNGVEVTSGITKELSRFTLTTTPSAGAVVVATYHSADDNLKAYTFGMRGNGDVAPMSFVEGLNNDASGYVSHAEGRGTEANGIYSHAEGYYTDANGEYSHAEGCVTKANGDWSHAEGYYTEASGDYSHAHGIYTKAGSASQTAIGEYNIEDASSEPYYRGRYAFIIGNGTSVNARSNALTVTWDGNVEMALDTTAASGTDHDLYAAIVALGWQNGVIV